MYLFAAREFGAVLLDLQILKYRIWGSSSTAPNSRSLSVPFPRYYDDLQGSGFQYDRTEDRNLDQAYNAVLLFQGANATIRIHVRPNPFTRRVVPGFRVGMRPMFKTL